MIPVVVVAVTLGEVFESKYARIFPALKFYDLRWCFNIRSQIFAMFEALMFVNCAGVGLGRTLHTIEELRVKRGTS